MVLPSVSCLAVSPVAVQVVLPCECSEPKKIALLIAATVPMSLCQACGRVIEAKAAKLPRSRR
ncbi:unnamed protein product [Fusarium graminearum]|uniref:Uncharacterized protein n=1 Tax=Gibberella zeae TaxID=5518 RepID=A0A9N8WVK5_GIBZA|nr:unnamed protein product [Fusarium graminearum]